METSVKKEEELLKEAISPRSIELSRRIRQLAIALKEKAETTPLAADALILSNEVGNLCDFVEQLHGNVETLLTKLEDSSSSANKSDQRNVTAEDEKAIEIQREIHEHHPTVLETVKALFMWRDSPEQRLRDDK